MCEKNLIPKKVWQTLFSNFHGNFFVKILPLKKSCGKMYEKSKF